jgi:hypothetical protein
LLQFGAFFPPLYRKIWQPWAGISLKFKSLFFETSGCLSFCKLFFRRYNGKNLPILMLPIFGVPRFTNSRNSTPKKIQVVCPGGRGLETEQIVCQKRSAGHARLKLLIKE